MTWWMYALLSAVFAALTAVLAKVGVEGVPSTLATALRTVVVLVFAASRVAPIDKLSLALTVTFAVLILKEPLSWRLGLGVALIVAGTLLTLK